MPALSTELGWWSMTGKQYAISRQQIQSKFENASVTDKGIGIAAYRAMATAIEKNSSCPLTGMDSITFPPKF